MCALKVLTLTDKSRKASEIKSACLWKSSQCSLISKQVRVKSSEAYHLTFKRAPAGPWRLLLLARMVNCEILKHELRVSLREEPLFRFLFRSEHTECNDLPRLKPKLQGHTLVFLSQKWECTYFALVALLISFEMIWRSTKILVFYLRCGKFSWRKDKQAVPRKCEAFLCFCKNASC